MRLNGWPEALQLQVDSAAGRAFEWGEFDCCLFAADCVKAISGIDYAKDYRGKYRTRLGAIKQLMKRGEGDIAQTIDGLFSPVTVSASGRGDLCLIKYRNDNALAVVIDHRCVVPAVPCGLAYLPKRNAIKAWKV